MKLQTKWVLLRQAVSVLTALMLLVACVHNEPVDPSVKEVDREDLTHARNAVADLSEMLLGTFMTGPQEVGTSIIDRKILIRSSSHSNDGAAWIYYQLNTGEDKDLYRQRIIKLLPVGNKVIQKTFMPKQMELWVNAWASPDLIASFKVSDVEPVFEQGCDQVWQTQELANEAVVWRAYVDPNTCKIFSERRQSRISIESETILSNEALKQAERGFDEQLEKQLFGTKTNEFITLVRKSQ